MMIYYLGAVLVEMDTILTNDNDENTKVVGHKHQ